MKTTTLTKPMAVINRRRPVLTDGMRVIPGSQAILRSHPENTLPAVKPPMPPESQLRYPVLFAVLLLIVAMFTLNFIMRM